jgi:hypothetical protein
MTDLVSGGQGSQKLSTHVSPYKVNEKDITGQLIRDYMISLSEEEREDT